MGRIADLQGCSALYTALKLIGSEEKIAAIKIESGGIKFFCGKDSACSYRKLVIRDYRSTSWPARAPSRQSANGAG
jgi:hypothetical protein